MMLVLKLDSDDAGIALREAEVGRVRLDARSRFTLTGDDRKVSGAYPAGSRPGSCELPVVSQPAFQTLIGLTAIHAPTIYREITRCAA